MFLKNELDGLYYVLARRTRMKKGNSAISKESPFGEKQKASKMVKCSEGKQKFINRNVAH